MKLRRCYIGRYSVLRQLNVDFSTSITDDSLALDFLVGPNGCGKSTLLQALTEIFSKLEISVGAVDFPFMVEYEIWRDNTAQIYQVANCEWEGDTLPDHVSGMTTIRRKVDDNSWETIANWSNELLPRAIAILTTGSEEGWQQLLAVPAQGSGASAAHIDATDNDVLIQHALSELPGPLPPANDDEGEPLHSAVTLIPTQSLALVTLCGTLVEMSRNESDKLGTLQDVFNDTQVKQICGFSLRFRLNEGIAKKQTRSEVEELVPLATRAVHLGSDRLLYFDLTGQPKQQAERILAQFGGGFDMYKWLLSLHSGEAVAERVVQEINVFIQRGRSNEGQQREHEAEIEAAPLHLLAWLSDGEQSFLGRMSLFSMLKDRESLVLLDEPEVHFNDYWKRQIVYRLESALKDQHSHALITTHSSITLTDVPREDIIVLHRGENYTQESGKPRIPTLAADPSDIIVHVFQAPYATGERAVRRITDTLNKVGNQTGERQREELQRLQRQVGPGYWSYRIRRALQQV